jgi:uncharacterized repeat protein (TIGR03803 family)
VKTTLIFPLLFVSLGLCAQTYTPSTLVSFPPIAGTSPYYPGDVTIDSVGNLYGTSSGGTASGTLFPNGTIFKVSPSGQLIVLHYFNGPDGSNPEAGVTLDPAGNLYGTTLSGGAFQFYGTVYKLAPDGTETVLYSFPNKFPQGNYPAVPVTVDRKGNLFGYTFFTDNNFNSSAGSVFELVNQSTFTLRYRFGSNATGPVGQPILDKYGNFYGATCCNQIEDGGGNVFKLDAKSGTITVLYTFDILSDKVYGPMGTPVMDSAGNLFDVGTGGIYEILASGREKAFYVEPSGIVLEPLLTIDAQGNLYGTNQHGGTFGFGAVYRVDPNGVETDLYSSDGPTLNGHVAIDRQGNLYVSENRGGVNGTGAIIKLTRSAD